MIASLIPSFNAGELSPLIHLRSDLEKYKSGCRTLQNMLISPYGGARKREGFEYAATLPGTGRLFPFQGSNANGFILAFTEGAIRFFKGGTVIQDGGGDYVVASPYGADELNRVQISQLNDVAYLVHPDYPVHRLARFADDDWELAEVEFDYPPMRAENLRKSHKITTASAGNIGDTITLTSDFDAFYGGNVGSYYALAHERAVDQFDVELDATAANDGLTSDPLIVQGDWSFSTRGTWTGKFLIQRSTDDGDSWHAIRQFTSEADANYTEGGTEPSRVLLRLKWEHEDAGTSNPKAVLTAVGAFIRGLVKVKNVISKTEARAEVIQAVEAGATSYWRESAWSERRGFPRTVTAHEQRIVYGGNASEKQTLWASAVDDFENFEPGVEDSDSWAHTFASDQQNLIRWMISQKALLIGTSGDEWVVSASKDESIITPTNVRARRHSGNGSEYLRPTLINDAVLFVQRGGKKLREMSYSYEADGYRAEDLTILAEHITGSGVIDTAYQAQTDSILWCVTREGVLIGLTYEKAQAVVGWHRHTTGGNADGFVSVATRRNAGDPDQVWVIVRRVINGADVFTVERMKQGGYFLETPWSLLYVEPTDEFSWDLLLGDPTGIDPWSELFRSYVVYDVRLDGSETFVCIADHTCTSSSTSPSTDPANWAQVFAYIPSVPGGISVGQYYSHNDAIYICIQAHGSPANGAWEPGVGADWEDYYTLTPADGGPSTDWVGQDEYAPGEKVTQGSSPGKTIFECTVAHAPGPTNEPGAGVDWEDYWVWLRGMYMEGDRIQEVGKVYEATIDHYPEEDTKPPVGEAWATKWIRAQGQYFIGDKVSTGGQNYLCLVTHTPTNGTKPGSGVDWQDYWSIRTTDNLLFFVDGGRTQQDVTLTEFTGLNHLEGETVQILGNGSVLTPRVVTGGKVLFNQPNDPPDGEFTDVSVGLGYDAVLEPMALEVGMQNGTSVSREKRIHDLVLYFKDSYGCQVGVTHTGDFDRVAFFDANDPNSPTLFTGPILHKMDSRHDLNASFILKQTLPMPMHVLAIVPKFNIYGDQG